MRRDILFSSHNSRRSPGKPSCRGKLLAFAEFAGELDHHNHSELLLRLRGAELSREERRVLRLACLDKAATDCFAAIPA